MKSIYPAGIVRNTPDEATPDGALLEAINTRNKDGARRGVGGKVVDAVSLANVYTYAIPPDPDDVKIYYHPQSGLHIVIVKQSSNYVVQAWQANSSGGTISSFLPNPNNTYSYNSLIIDAASDASISHVGNFVYISSYLLKQRWVLYWNTEGNGYAELVDIPAVKFVASAYNRTNSEVTQDITGLTTDDEKYTAIIGKFNAFISDKAKEGYVNGRVAIRYAFKLFDGSYIMHSELFYAHPGFKTYDASGTERGGSFEIEWDATTATITSGGYDTLPATKYLHVEQVRIIFDCTDIYTILQQWYDLGLIKSLCVFSSSVVKSYDVPEKWDNLIEASPGATHGIFPINTERVKGIADPQSFFKVKEWEISELNERIVYFIPDYSNIELNEHLPPDNFSHHKYIPECQYTYNSKIHGGNILTLLGNTPDNYFRKYFDIAYSDQYLDDAIEEAVCGALLTKTTTPSNYEIYFNVELITDDGLKIVSTLITDNVYNDGSDDYLLLNPIIIYPDIRAKRFAVVIKNLTNGDSEEVFSGDLKPSDYNNYAYHAADLYREDTRLAIEDVTLMNHFIEVRLATYSDSMPETDHADVINDYNRIQVSKQNNPFVWPADNSYRFGSEDNTILGMITAQEPITETVFGQ